MKPYAIIQFQGKQYQVAQDQELTVNQVDTPEGKTIKVSDVLLTNSDAGISIGTPTVAGASVTLKVASHQKSDKLRVAQYKSKSRYRRVYGHRQPQSTLIVSKLTLAK